MRNTLLVLLIVALGYGVGFPEERRWIAIHGDVNNIKGNTTSGYYLLDTETIVYDAKSSNYRVWIKKQMKYPESLIKSGEARDPYDFYELLLYEFDGRGYRFRWLKYIMHNLGGSREISLSEPDKWEYLSPDSRIYHIFKNVEAYVMRNQKRDLPYFIGSLFGGMIAILGYALCVMGLFYLIGWLGWRKSLEWKARMGWMLPALAALLAFLLPLAAGDKLVIENYIGAGIFSAIAVLILLIKINRVKKDELQESGRSNLSTSEETEEPGLGTPPNPH